MDTKTLEEFLRKVEPRRTFEGAYKAYWIFWALKLGLVEGKKSEGKPSPQLTELVNKLVDFCNE
ncbi:hypothetical protein M1295_03395 [Patescibacteria group bacterium]|nr:hypothetical protein [Patescibacteria group bacterium]